MTSTSEPTLSVVVIVLGGPGNLTRCLRALQAQHGGAFEIIVPVDEHFAGERETSDLFPNVRILRTAGRRTYAELRSLGVRAARGRIVALTEDHCIPAPDWCEQIVRAHESPHAAVGGVVEKQADVTALNWAMYFCDYAR